MLNDAKGFSKIFIATGYSDLRKGIDGLANIIKFQFDLDPFQKDILFLFCGGRTDRLKGLVWEGDGLLLLYKRLNVGRFSWPRTPAEAMEITPEQFLKGFEGLVVTDSYSAYGKLDRESDDLSFTAFWAHARRRYSDALKALPKGKKDAAAKQTVAYEALTRIAAIYHLDNELAELEPGERQHKRKLVIEPLVEAYCAWLKEVKQENVLLSGKTLEGVNYSLNHERALRMFLEDGEVPLDNNATEGTLRNFCLHKHTWKLIDTIDGAKSSAIIYSIVETAKANHLHPFRYLEFLLETLKEHQDDTGRTFIDDLLPWSPKLPDICRVK